MAPSFHHEARICAMIARWAGRGYDRHRFFRGVRRGVPCSYKLRVGRADVRDFDSTRRDREGLPVRMTPTGPLKLLPTLDAKPWGGRQLANWGIALPENDRIGEALLTAPESTVAAGELAGTSLGELVRSAPEVWIGERGREATGGRELFPLLIKLIDAQSNLSVQVHPDDQAAAAAGLGTGKTEAYHILAADPG